MYFNLWPRLALALKGTRVGLLSLSMHRGQKAYIASFSPCRENVPFMLCLNSYTHTQWPRSAIPTTFHPDIMFIYFSETSLMNEKPG